MAVSLSMVMIRDKNSNFNLRHFYKGLVHGELANCYNKV